jgi:hypothetical protein
MIDQTLKAVVDNNCDTYKVNEKESSITWRTKPTDDGDDADYFLWDLDDSGNLSVSAHDRNDHCITGWNYEEDITTPEQLEEAISDFDGLTGLWS